MKLHKTTCRNDANDHFFEFASSEAAASKARTRLKKAGLRKIDTEEVEVATTRAELITFLNKLGAHESWILAAAGDA